MWFALRRNSCDTNLRRPGLPGQSTQRLCVTDVIGLLQQRPADHLSLNGHKLDQHLTEWLSARKNKMLCSWRLSVRGDETPTYLLLNIPHDDGAVTAGRRLTHKTDQVWRSGQMFSCPTWHICNCTYKGGLSTLVFFVEFSCGDIMMWSLIKDWKCATGFSLIIYFTYSLSEKLKLCKINQLYTLTVTCHFDDDDKTIILIVFNYDWSHGSLQQSSVKASRQLYIFSFVNLEITGLHFPGLPTRKSSLGSKATLRTGASWPRSVFCWLLSDTSTTFTMKSLRRAEELRINMCKQACVGNLCSHVTDKGNISSEPTRVQIVKSMKRRSKIILISSNIHQNVDATSALTASDAWFLFFFFSNQYHNRNYQDENSSINELSCSVLLLLWSTCLGQINSGSKQDIYLQSRLIINQ